MSNSERNYKRVIEDIQTQFETKEKSSRRKRKIQPQTNIHYEEEFYSIKICLEEGKSQKKD